MSTAVMAACWPIQCPPTPKAVLISLADNANDHGYCWPSIATICERTCFSKRAVIDAIQWLEEHGLLEADRTNGRHTKYQIVPNGRAPDLFASQKTGAARAPVRQVHRVTTRTGAGNAPVQQPHEPVRQMHTNRQEPLNPSLRSGFGARAENSPAVDDEGKPKRSPTGTRLPQDWQPDDDDLLFASEQGVDGSAEAAKYRDYWHSVAGAKGRRQDWDAVWRNWIRRAAEDLSRHQKTRSHDHETPRRSLAERAADSHRHADERDRRAGIG